MDEIINYVMNTPGNTNPNVLKRMLDQLDSGGGSSDFSIAEVQVYIDSSANVNSYSVATIEEDTIGIIIEYGSGTFEVPIYKNGSIMYLDMSDNNLITTTGDIIYNRVFHYFLITGNGTITISNDDDDDDESGK